VLLIVSQNQYMKPVYYFGKSELLTKD